MNQLNKINVNGTVYDIGGSGGGGYDLVVKIDYDGDNNQIAEAPEVEGSLYAFWDKYFNTDDIVTTFVIEHYSYLSKDYISKNMAYISLEIYDGEFVLRLQNTSGYQQNPGDIYIYPTDLGSTPTSDTDMTIEYGEFTGGGAAPEPQY